MEERTAVLKHETLIRRFPLKTKQWRKAGFNCVADAKTFCKSSFVYGLLLLMYRASVTLYHYTCNSRLTRVLVKITAQARSFEWNFSLAESSLAHTVTPPLIYRNFGKVIIAESWFCFSEFVVRRGTSRRRYKIQDTTLLIRFTFELHRKISASQKTEHRPRKRKRVECRAHLPLPSLKEVASSCSDNNNYTPSSSSSSSANDNNTTTLSSSNMGMWSSSSERRWGSARVNSVVIRQSSV